MSGTRRRPAACADTAGAILAGGMSQRMGRPKAFIEVGGRSLIRRVADVLEALLPEVLIVSSDAAPFRGLGLRVVPDLRPRAGPLAGAQAALTAAGRPQVLVVGCDMPFLNPALLAHLAARAKGHDAAVPRTPDGYHPLHAVYTRGALGPIAAALERGDNKFVDLLPHLDVAEIGEAELRRLDPELASLFNINRPEDLLRAEEALGRERRGGPAGRVRQDA